MTYHIHRLTGCTPTPLANYLKALGILRLIGEQLDANARGWWQDDSFCLITVKTKEELEAFFLNYYQPTPMVSPWNKGCGFFKDDDPGLAPLEKSIAPRFERFRAGVRASRKLLDSISQADAVVRAIKARTKTNKMFQSEEQRKLLRDCVTIGEVREKIADEIKKVKEDSKKLLALEAELATIDSIVSNADKPPSKPEAERLKKSDGYKRFLNAADRQFKLLKAALIPDCRREWRGHHAEWMSAALVLEEDGTPQFPSLLGTGGNDGNLDFTNTFMQRLVDLFDVTSELGAPKAGSETLLRESLWSEPCNQLADTSVGQFQPGALGGVNSSTGTVGPGSVNAWDFVLMMEGSIVFRSRATKRLSPIDMARVSAPFAIRTHAAGHASPGLEKSQRGEQWMPLWSRPSTSAEVSTLFSEARIQLGKQTANRPVDAARAISRLGVARGVHSFTRFGYLERNGQSTLAVPLGKVNVRLHPMSSLIDDLAPWMDQLQRRARDNHAPGRLVHAERSLSNAVFEALTKDEPQNPNPRLWQAILRAASRIELIQANGTAFEAGPIPLLSPKWIHAINDGSTEVRLAAALGSAASVYRRGIPVDSVRLNCLPLESGRFPKYKVSDKRIVNDPRVVVYGRDVVADLIALVERRLIESTMKGTRRLPLVAAFGCGARLRDIAAFLNGSLDLAKIFELARALMAVNWQRWNKNDLFRTNTVDAIPDEAWLMIRLANLAGKLDDNRDIPAEPGIVRQLTAGNSAAAVAAAARRMRSSGIRPPVSICPVGTTTARLWAAALVFPILPAEAHKAVGILDPRLLKGAIHG